MKKIYINSGTEQIKGAVLENEQLVEYFIEKPTEELVGNIYIGKVINVLPGMQAAFVDIGVGKNAFLYVSDALPPNEEESVNIPNIREVLKEGQKIIVQVLKEPFGNKGPRVTTHISLPGRYLVYMPNANYVGISRRITDEADRNHFKELGEKIREADEGLIIRTVTSDANEEQITKDLKFLRSLWQTISEQSKKGAVPSLIYKDLDLISRLVRDLFSEEVRQFVIDNGFEYKRVKDIVANSTPELSDRIYHYTGKEHIFDAYNIQTEIDKITKKKVWLKSGGYIIIDKTEALTVIDVNTGKFIGQSNLEDTVFKTNIEAAIEISKQLRLRDIGGIIIIDFIDMESEENGQKILATLQTEMKKDRTKSNILGITQLGLVEMTRKKVRKSKDTILLRPCPVCDGSGTVIPEVEIINKIEREVTNYKEHTSIKTLTIDVHPLLIHYLRSETVLKRLEQLSDKKISLNADENLHYHQYNVHFKLN